MSVVMMMMIVKISIVSREDLGELIHNGDLFVILYRLNDFVVGGSFSHRRTIKMTWKDP